MNFVGIVLSSSGMDRNSKIIFCGIWVLLILAFVIGRIQSKKRYERMMSSVMETNGDDYKTGNGENTCVWKIVTDAAVVRGYWKDCLKAKFNLWNIIKVLLVVVGIMLGIFAVIRLVQGEGKYWVWLILLAIGIYIIFPRSSMLHDDSIVFRRLVPRMVQSLFGSDAVYLRTKALDSEQLKKLNFYEHHPEEIKGRDYISGVYKGVQFECSFENAEYTGSDGDGHDATRSTFYGIMLVLPYRKTSGSMLGLRGKAQHEIKERSGKKLFCNRRDETENKEFNRLFHIISQDDENLFYMLTPATMEKLIALYKTFSGCSERLHVCFKEDKLYIGVPLWNYMNYKPATSGTSGLKKIQKSLWNDLCIVKAVLDLALTL
ncbi:MAG: DUF3137 domain-containing protein [Lachnospiraceae bacterium]|nr:DUF3137 domain-containing protein [Lachnospiraceae bacterium]MBP3506343.1 DUF3137 domain-containing protein [Lachnospiraceae bacterium]